MSCSDHVKHLMYPLIFFKTADFEEQWVYQLSSVSLPYTNFRCVMCLTRGLEGLCPCTCCLIPKANLPKYTIAELRTPQLSIEILAWANAASTSAEKEEILK